MPLLLDSALDKGTSLVLETFEKILGNVFSFMQGDKTRDETLNSIKASGKEALNTAREDVNSVRNNVENEVKTSVKESIEKMKERLETRSPSSSLPPTPRNNENRSSGLER